MSIDVADTKPEQLVPVNELQHLAVHADPRLRQVAQVGQHDISLPQTTQCNLPDNEWMDQYTPKIEQMHKHFITRP
jgi:hypothetical protein